MDLIVFSGGLNLLKVYSRVVRQQGGGGGGAQRQCTHTPRLAQQNNTSHQTPLKQISVKGLYSFI